VLTVVSVAWLWSMTAPRVCILIYPAPPGCATVIPNWLPFIGVGIEHGERETAGAGWRAFPVQGRRPILAVRAGR